MLLHFGLVDSEGKLPAGYELVKDHASKVYYIDHVRKTTSWARPIGGSSSIHPIPPEFVLDPEALILLASEE